MKHTLAFLIVLSSAACKAPPPPMNMPKPYERNGVRVMVKELFGPDDTVLGIAGEAVNVGKVELKTCTLNFDVLDFAELKVADAAAYKENFAPGEHWQFQAQFSVPFTTDFDSVHAGPIVVTK
jgi:hypothetical protein